CARLTVVLTLFSIQHSLDVW
nr:immunoglobulin heavy chain junction region [Macaca mulatta]